MIKPLSILLLIFIFSSCRQAREPSHIESIYSEESWYQDTFLASDKGPLPNKITERHLLDIRGVGDSGWVHYGEKNEALTPTQRYSFEKALNKMDPFREVYVGDLSFINIESVLGVYCDEIRETIDYFFLMHPDSVRQAIDHGFNIISLANNHAQDCDLGRSLEEREPVHGPIMSTQVMNDIAREKPVLWHGTQDEDIPFEVSVKEFEIKGRSIKVAFGSIALIGWKIPRSNYFNWRKSKVMDRVEKFLATYMPDDPNFADLRILSIHTQDRSAYKKPEDGAVKLLKKIGETFVKKYQGDVVFGHGPHTAYGVKVVENEEKHRGVVFVSLGNFIHPRLRTVPANYAGRVVYDMDSMAPKYIQVYPFENKQTALHRVGGLPESNFKFFYNPPGMSYYSHID